MSSPAAKFPHFNVVISVSALIVMIVIYSVWSINSSFRMAIDAGELQAAGYARAFSEHAESAFLNSDRLLLDVIEDFHEEGYSNGSLPFSKILRILKTHVANSPQIVSMILVDRKGNVLADASMDGQPAFNVSDREYFSFHQNNPGSGLFVSRPFKSRVSNKWRFSFSRPLLDSRGEFAGVVTILFNIEYFRNFYRSIPIGKEGRVVLVHRDSPVLVMEPFSEESMKLDYSNSVLFREKLPKSMAGTFHLEKGIVVKSSARMISYRTLENFPVIALVSFDREELLAPWRSSAIKQAVTTIILCLAVIILAALHLRQMRRLEETKEVLVAQQNELRSGEAQRLHVEAQLLQAQKMESVGQLAGGIAHDFNNLLTPIIGYAELLRRTLPSASEEMLKLDGILGAATRAKDLTKQLLGFARKQIMSMTVIELNSVISSFKEILRRVVRESIDLNMQFDPAPLHICADQSQLEHVLLNLAVNAQDAITGHGVINISTSRVYLGENAESTISGLPHGRYVVLTVSDTGTGIDSKDIDHIFEPFFTTKQAGHGTGLGLAMVYGIIKQHNGVITVQSSPGKGTLFTICLPEVEGTALCTIPAEMPVETQQSDSARVLVVEDNEMVRDMVIHILTAEGHQIKAAETAEHAMAIVASEPSFDLLVSDVIMPGMNGPDMYAKMLEISPQLKALFISGYSNDPALMSAVDTELVLFLQKPFSVQDLVAKVTELLKANA